MPNGEDIVANEDDEDIYGKHTPSDKAQLKAVVGDVTIVAEEYGPTGSTSREISLAATPATAMTITTAVAIKETETDKISDAIEEFDGEYDDEELRLYRLKFMSEVAN